MRSLSSRHAPSSAVILLVDDNHDGLMARQCVLEELGYKVISASCGREALQLAGQQPVDLIITDYKMVPVNGLELIEQLRKTNVLAPVILLTGFANNVGLCPENTGANIVLQKSADELATLLRHIKRLLQPPKKPARSHSTRKALARSQGTGS
jgi:CheY-like chemotaxis protein